MKILIDSSVYLSAFLFRDSFRPPSIDFLEKIKAAHIEIILPRLILLEIMNVLGKSEETEARIRAITNTLKESPQTILVDHSSFLETLFFFFYKKISLKTSDFLLLLTAVQHDAVLVCWDKTLLREAKKIIRCFTPEEFLRLAQTGP